MSLNTATEEQTLLGSESFSEEQYRVILRDWDFVSTYMSSQAAWELQAYSISCLQLLEKFAEAPLLGDFLPIWRLRFLLFYFRDLRDIVDQILREVSLEIELVDVLCRGEIRGRLNVPAYLQTRPRISGAPTFPCRRNRISYNTEENQLLAYTLLAIQHELWNLVPPEALGNPERKEIQNDLDYISSILHQAYFEPVMADEHALLRFDATPPLLEYYQPLLERIRQKSERRIIAAGYAQLTEWFERFYLRQSIQPAAIGSNAPMLQALYYGKGFYNTLYELWLLARIIRTMQDKYGFELRDPKPFYEIAATALADSAQRAEPVCKLVSARGHQLRIFYRKGSGVLWNNPQEGLPDNPYWAGLGGEPDITITLGKGSARPARFILDAKNRHWAPGGAPPAEEIYKMVGYLSNFRRSDIVGGALLFRSDTEPHEPYRYWSRNERGVETNDEVVVAYSVSPSEDIRFSQKPIDDLCEFVLERLGLALPYNLTLQSLHYRKSYQEAAKDPANDQDDIVEQQFLVPLYIFCDELANKRKREVEQNIASLKRDYLGDLIDRMSPEGRKYLATAEMLYKEIGPTGDYDYAAAMICYARCMEREVNFQLLMPFKQAAIAQAIPLSPSANLSMPTREPTLGGVVTELKRCIDPSRQGVPVYAMLQQWIKDHSYKEKTEYLLKRFPNLLEQFNAEYRHGAAHTELVTYSRLVACRSMILGIGCDRLLHDFLSSLKPGSSSSV